MGSGVWVYRHDGELPESLESFWELARRNFGMKDGDCVIFVAGKEAILIVV